MPTSSSMEELSRKADFIFDGTVKEVKGKTASVTVDAIQNGTEVLRGFEGQDITVQLSGDQKLKAGQSATFFTNPTEYGETLGVQSLGEVPSEGGGVGGFKLAGVAAGADPVQAKKDRDTKARYDDCDLVISGRVVSVSLPEGADEERGGLQVSEHDPLWRDATIQIDAVHKGAHPSKSITVRFPSSEDMKWYASPKFHVGQEGYFMLRKGDIKTRRAGRSGTKTSEAYTALSPLDFQPSNEEEGIKKLVASGG